MIFRFLLHAEKQIISPDRSEPQKNKDGGPDIRYQKGHNRQRENEESLGKRILTQRKS